MKKINKKTMANASQGGAKAQQQMNYVIGFTKLQEVRYAKSDSIDSENRELPEINAVVYENHPSSKLLSMDKIREIIGGHLEGLIEKDKIAPAIESLKIHHSNGNLDATEGLGLYYWEEGEFEKAAPYLGALVSANKEEYAYRYALLCRDGKGTEKNASFAFELFKRAFEYNRDPDALTCMADALKEGIGVEKNVEVALIYYLCAELLGSDGEASLKLGIAYLGDDEIKQDLKKAAEHLKIATRAEYKPIASLARRIIKEYKLN